MTVFARAILIACFAFAVDAAVGKDLPVSTTSKIIDANNELSLEMSVVNNGTETLQMYKADLPWGTVGSTLILVVKPNRYGTLVQREYLIDDPGPNMIKLDVSEALSGKVNIYRLFPDLKKRRTQEEYVLFWSYVAKDISGNRARRTGGMHTIPRE